MSTPINTTVAAVKPTSVSLDLSRIDFNQPNVIIDLGKLVKTVDLRPTIDQMGIALRNQGGRGTCSVFASTFLLEYMVSKERGLKNLDFSEEYLNAVANRATNTLGDGDFFSSIAEGYKAFGIVDEAWFPYRPIFDPALQPDDELTAIGEAARFYKPDFMYSKKQPTAPGQSPKGLDDIQLAAVLKYLDKGVPVAFGFHGAANTKTVSVAGLTIMHDLVNELDGQYAHSVPIVGYSAASFIPSGGYLIYRNSAGPNWGDHGYGYMSFNYARKFIYDAVVYERSPQFLPALHAVTKPLSRPKIGPPPIQLLDSLGKLIHPSSRM